MWKTIYPVSYLSTRWPFIWLGVHFQRDLYLMFHQHQRTESLLKILSNQRSQAGERVESSEWRFRSCKTPKTVEGSILSTQLYYLPLVFFIFKWVRRKYLKTCSMYFVCTRCCICSSTWLMINKYPELSGSIKNESHKAAWQTRFRWREFKKNVGCHAGWMSAFLLHVNVNIQNLLRQL